jgi:glycosyltransferase involved in cell wall biosynthesis
MNSKESIKLFVDAHVFDGEFQGTRTYIKELYTILSQKKNVLLFVGAHDVDNLKKNFPDVNNIFFLKYKSSSSFWRLIYEIPSLIKKYSIDIAHFQYISPLVKRCKYVVTTHDVIFNEYPQEFSFAYRFTKNWLFKRSAMRADLVTTDSEYSKKLIHKYLNIEPKNIYVIPIGVSAKYFDSYDKKEAKQFIHKKYGFEKFILFVSRMEPRKNHSLLLKAYLELKLYSQGYYLALLGHESIAVPLFREMIDQLPDSIKAFIFKNGEVNDSDLLEFYRAADLFVYPSKAEGFGIPPLEAGALRIPVVCSNTTAMQDFSFFGKSHIDPLDYHLFKSTLADMIRDPPDEVFLEQLSKTIKQKYSWGRSAENFYLLLQNHFLSKPLT